jgi:hypothetical protein
MTVNIGQGLLNALIYMGPLAVIAGLVSMWLWERTCRLKIRVVTIKTAGGTTVDYVPKQGDTISIQNKDEGTTRTWPISRLATIPRPYPDLAGLLPRFIQREIQEAILIEGDWEPLLNRSPHREKVMSPDVVKYLQQIAKDTPAVSDKINSLLDGVSTSPTRELICSPEVLGALKVSTVMKALASVSDDLLEALKQIRNQLARFAGLNATYVYIGLVLILILQCVILYFTINAGQATDISALNEKLDVISKALGVR